MQVRPTPLSAERTGADDEGLFADDSASEEHGDTDRSPTVSDAEGRFDPISPEAPAGTEAPAATAAPAGDSSADSAVAESASDDAEGGLFGSESAPPEDRSADDAARFEDNTFQDYGYRQFVDAGDDPLSTFALDVDTGSFTVTRRWLDEGSLPPIESVRPEEYINAFHYDYRAPRRGLDVTIDGGPSPFDAATIWSVSESRARSSRMANVDRRH